MAVKLIITVTMLADESIDFKLEFDDSEQKAPLEKKIAESLASASLVELGRISGATDGELIED